ncbi:MAG: glycosyltransferase family 2 protein [Microcystis sp. M_OC_Ca_00000000_S217Cul]|uniref:glycosyltransferase family 2 protein n=1 Tax=Microcystis sp. M_OC_Ca_00000000_S217Cul TaxID=2486214 RepID=UPI00119180D0|nr:glycosyltransferase family 2 protein [Microcystis sp. M_OC_Ca_00000000_S217Cul]TRT69737.1 MAG: glycosyltransferase family 2 protein [Microcystis sp. M_OC_Ca_00000000_S217Cul]
MENVDGYFDLITSEPRVSIGLPVYNGERFICSAIETLLSQTFSDFEIIISDNCSTDKTESICRQYAAKDARIRYVRQTKNVGITANFQFVLDAAVGEYFMWAAADDRQKPEFIQTLVKILDDNPSFAGAMSDVENHDEAGTLLFISMLDDIRVDKVKENWKNIRLRFFRNPTSNVFFAIYGLFKRDILLNIEINYKNLLGNLSSSEVPFLAQISLRGEIASVGTPLKIYTRHENSEYHKEIKRINKMQSLIQSFNVSKSLALIAYHSKIDITYKFLCYYTVFFTFFKHLISIILPTPILKSIIKIKFSITSN